MIKKAPDPKDPRVRCQKCGTPWPEDRFAACSCGFDPVGVRRDSEEYGDACAQYVDAKRKSA